MKFRFWTVSRIDKYCSTKVPPLELTLWQVLRVIYDKTSNSVEICKYSLEAN